MADRTEGAGRVPPKGDVGTWGRPHGTRRHGHCRGQSKRNTKVFQMRKSRTYKAFLQKREYPRIPRNVGKRGPPGYRGEPGRGTIKTLPFTWEGEGGETATGRGLVDTGAESTFFGWSWIEKNGIPVEQTKKPERVRLADGKQGDLTSTVRGKVRVLGKATKGTYWATTLLHDAVLGMDWIQRNQPQWD
jgi:Aspartyl protease